MVQLAKDFFRLGCPVEIIPILSKESGRKVTYLDGVLRFVDNTGEYVDKFSVESSILHRKILYPLEWYSYGDSGKRTYPLS